MSLATSVWLALWSEKHWESLNQGDYLAGGLLRTSTRPKLHLLLLLHTSVRTFTLKVSHTRVYMSTYFEGENLLLLRSLHERLS
jgi:hypothetical protein